MKGSLQVQVINFNVKIIVLPKQGGDAVTVTKKLFPKRAYISGHFIHA